MTRFSRAFAPLALFGALLLAATPTLAQERRPVVVELFTSQGCSSCPPADSLLADLAARPDVLALAFHVDYWDYVGWRDRFAQPAFAERQRAYTKTLGAPMVYTPQMIIDGTTEVIGSRRSDVLDAVEAAGMGNGIETQARIVDRPGARLAVTLGAADLAPAEIMLAVFGRPQETSVEQGENRGRVLRNANMVLRFETLGQWRGEALEMELPLEPAELRSAGGVAVIVQQRSGRILGAAIRRFAGS